MNYEELLESRNGAAMKESMPFGMFGKRIVDNKYVNVVELRDDLKDSLLFCDALKAESEQNMQLNHKNQLHFTLAKDSEGLGINVEQGTFRTFDKLLEDNPAIVAAKNFIDDTIKDLLEFASFLHDHGIFHICYAPSNILARKGDNVPMLLFHGSAYQSMNSQQELYGEQALAFIAPEVVDRGVFDARADIYSIGKFVEFLYAQADVPFELKGVIKKATDADPEKRYQTPEEMMAAIKNRKGIRSSIVSGVAAMAIVLILFGLYFVLVPERENIEFVKPAPKEAVDEPSDIGVYDPSTGSYVTSETDTLSMDVRVSPQKMKEYNAKAEQIFRKKFSREAERILSSIYNDEKMNNTEKNFMAGSQPTLEDLMKAQVKMGMEAGLSDSRSQLIAGQIIEQVSNKLKTQMDKKKEEDKKEESNISDSNNDNNNEN